MRNDSKSLYISSIYPTEAFNYILFHLETWYNLLAKALEASYIQYEFELCYPVNNWITLKLLILYPATLEPTFIQGQTDINTLTLMYSI